MYPLIFGVIPSYWLMVVLGLIAAMMVYRILSTVYRLDDGTFRQFGAILVAVIGLGFVFALIFQMIYDAAAGKELTFGITFLGGLLGAVLSFFILAFFCIKGTRKKLIWSLVCIAPPAVCIAHALGRVGCLLGGCCYGKPTDAWYGITFDGVKRIPTQLIETLFLAGLFVVLMVLVLRFKRFNLTVPVYLFCYSIFRFVLEYFRDDEARSVVGALSPSQWQSLFMIAVAIGVCVYIFWAKRVPFNGSQKDLSRLELTGFISGGADENLQKNETSQQQNSNGLK